MAGSPKSAQEQEQHDTDILDCFVLMHQRLSLIDFTRLNAFRSVSSLLTVADCQAAAIRQTVSSTAEPNLHTGYCSHGSQTICEQQLRELVNKP